MTQRDRIDVAARAMHHLFEQRAERTNPFYTRTRWEHLDHEHQTEFIEYATVMVTALQQVEEETL